MAHESDQCIAELTDRLETGIRELYASDKYAQYITAMSRFHNYSFRNSLLILLQCPHAYVVCQYYGIDTSDYSLAYVAGWSRDKDLSELKASLELIHSTAGEIIDAITPPQPELEYGTMERSRRTAQRR